MDFHCFSIQEDSEKSGKVTSAGLYFLHFQVYRMDSTVNAVLQVQIMRSLLIFPTLWFYVSHSFVIIRLDA